MSIEIRCFSLNIEAQERICSQTLASLAALAYALRHPESWPPGFLWDYSACGQCAMGLAYQLWSGGEKKPQDGREWHAWVSHLFDVSYEAAGNIFYSTVPPRSWRRPFASRRTANVTPEHVAGQIDRYLADLP